MPKHIKNYEKMPMSETAKLTAIDNEIPIIFIFFWKLRKKSKKNLCFYNLCRLEVFFLTKQQNSTSKHRFTHITNNMIICFFANLFEDIGFSFLTGGETLVMCLRLNVSCCILLTKKYSTWKNSQNITNRFLTLLPINPSTSQGPENIWWSRYAVPHHSVLSVC